MAHGAVLGVAVRHAVLVHNREVGYVTHPSQCMVGTIALHWEELLKHKVVIRWAVQV